MKKLLSALLAALLILSLSGCTGLSFNGEDTMRPPKASGDMSQIQKLIDKSCDCDYTLIYPSSGANRSAITSFDVDSDKKDDAVALYKYNNKIHVLFIKGTDSDFAVEKDLTIEDSSIDRVEFSDIDNDGKNEILIGYSNGSANTNTLNIYEFSSEDKNFDFSCLYSSFITGDFDYNGTNDILTLNLNINNEAYTANLFTYSDEDITKKSSCSIDSGVSKFINIQYGALNSTIVGAVVDSLTSSKEYSTQIIYYNADKSQLSNPMIEYSQYDYTKRTSQIPSADIDDDDIIEMPVCSVMEHNDDEDDKTVAKLVSYNNLNFSSMDLEKKQRFILCEEDSYTFELPQSWIDTTTARYDKDKRELTVYAFEYKDNKIKTTDSLLVIKTYNKDDFDKEKTVANVISQNASNVYTYTLPDNDSYMKISDEDVISNFLNIKTQ